MQDDKAIIEEVLQGNKEAYAHIIDIYNEKIVFIIRKNWEIRKTFKISPWKRTLR
ncbi:hypothetical protein ACSNN6_19820 [Brevibacillus formosus]